MRKLRIYLDTSVVNFVFADDAPDFKRATIDFFEDCANLYELYVSDVVIGEIDRDPDLAHRRQLLSVLAEHGVILLPNEDIDEIRQLAQFYVEGGIVTQAKMADALHVAYATVHEMDVLLSWNFRHLANLDKEARILAANAEQGYRYPLRLASPLEVLYD